MVNNGKVTAKHIRGGNPKITIRIKDPDGVANFWVYVMNNNGQWQGVGKGTGNCAKNIVFKVALNIAMVGQKHKVVYKDCQQNPAYEVWEITGQFTEWHDAEKKDSGYDSERFEPGEDEEFPQELEPLPWWEDWFITLLTGIFMVMLSIIIYNKRNEDK